MGFSTVGAVSIDERGITTVQSRVNGYIEKLYVRAQYDAVSQGSDAGRDLRARLAFRPGGIPRAEAEQSTRSRADSCRRHGSACKLLGISEEQIQAIERDGKPNPRVTLHAPEAGLVWELGTREGMAVSPGMTLFKLAPVGTVWVNAEVPETQAALIRARRGSRRRGLAAFPDTGLQGQGRGAAARRECHHAHDQSAHRPRESGGLLKPGMFARLEFGGHDQQAPAWCPPKR